MIHIITNIELYSGRHWHASKITCHATLNKSYICSELTIASFVSAKHWNNTKNNLIMMTMTMTTTTTRATTFYLWWLITILSITVHRLPTRYTNLYQKTNSCCHAQMQTSQIIPQLAFARCIHVEIFREIFDTILGTKINVSRKISPCITSITEVSRSSIFE